MYIHVYSMTQHRRRLVNEGNCTFKLCSFFNLNAYNMHRIRHKIKPVSFIINILIYCVRFSRKTFSWHDEKWKWFGNNQLVTLEMGHMMALRFAFGATLLVRRHVHKNVTAGANYLNVYLSKEDGFSAATTGLIGTCEYAIFQFISA